MGNATPPPKLLRERGANDRRRVHCLFCAPLDKSSTRRGVESEGMLLMMLRRPLTEETSTAQQQQPGEAAQGHSAPSGPSSHTPAGSVSLILNHYTAGPGQSVRLMWIDAGARVCCYLAPISSLIYVSVYLFLRAPLLVGRAATRNLSLSLSVRARARDRELEESERAARRGEKIGSSLDFVANAGVNKFTCSADADVGGPFRLWCVGKCTCRGQRMSFGQLRMRPETETEREKLISVWGVQFPILSS